MIPAAFDYVRVDSAAEAVDALVEHGDEAKLLAGGHSLVPLMKLRLATPTVLVDIGRLDDLAGVRRDGDTVVVGAMTRHHELETSVVLAESCPLLPFVAGQVGDPQVRRRGTIGGSIAHGDPASDLPAAVLALGAMLVVEGPSGRREIAADDFFLGFLETALAPDELLVEVRIPEHRGGWSFQKFTRRAQDWAIVAVAAVTGNRVGVGLVNMGVTPLRAGAVEAAIANGSELATAADLAAEGTEPSADLHASVEFREHLARVLTRRALLEATAR